MSVAAQEWLGPLPPRWRVQPAISLADIRVSTVDKKQYDGERPVRLCNYTDVYYGDRITDPSEFMEATATDDQIARFSLRAGDVPITKDSETADDIGISAFIERDLPGVVYGYHLAICRPKDYWTGRFIKYLFDATYTKALLETQTLGVTRVGLSQQTLHYMRWPVPPHEERRAIAEFLDYETGEIDAFIADQERLIGLLTERRLATIRNELAPNAGDFALLLAQDRIGVIDGTSVVGREFSVQLGKMLDAGRGPRLTDVETLYLRASNVKQGRLDLSDVKLMPFSSSERNIFSIQRNDLLVVEGGATSGACTVVPNDMPEFAYQKTLNRVRRHNVTQATDTTFLAYVIEIFRSAGVIDALCNQSTMPHFTAEKLRALRIPWPDRKRREEIMSILAMETRNLTAGIADAREAITLSEERRAALISAAVTGQIDVRDWKRPTTAR